VLLNLKFERLNHYRKLKHRVRILLCLLFLGAMPLRAQYCLATATGSCYRYLGQVSFGTINQTTQCSDYTAFYCNWSATASNTMLQGQTQSVSLTNTSSYTTYFRVWIDWNGDLDFFDAGESVLTSPATPSSGVYTASITCPLTATVGTTRMRVKADYYNNFGGGPCASSTETETQDYGIVITAPPPGSLFGQLNEYAAVTSICGSEFTVTSVAGFAAGDKVLVIQMRGATIDLTASSSFGSITAQNSAGLYEFMTVSAVSGSVIVMAEAPQFSYNTAGQVQLVKVYSSSLGVNTIAGTVTCSAWNGSTGGVVVIDVSGTLTFSGNIDVSGKGFRGGAPDNAAWGCNNAASYGYFYGTTSTYSAPKGEGIGSQLITTTNVEGRGRAANGGGGGNNVNAGGGGGSNGGAGGFGGYQWVSCIDPSPASTQGIPGLSMAAYYSNAANRIYMGGAGGGGHAGANVSGGGAGANGGGIVIIRAGAINGSGSILARGDNAVNITGQWSGGGGGAGGTVLIACSSVSGSLAVNASGGNGGHSWWPSVLGPGGGGGGGVLWVQNATVPAAITYSSNGGAAGVWQNGVLPWGETAGSAGISLTSLSMPPQSSLPQVICTVLPVNWLRFEAESVSPQVVRLLWVAGNETDVAGYIVERSADGQNFAPLAQLTALNNGASQNQYISHDDAPLPGISYYRIRQNDFNGQYSYSRIEVVQTESGIEESLVIWPNPVNESIQILFNERFAAESHTLTFYDATGRIIVTVPKPAGLQVVHFNVSDFAQGVYFLRCSSQQSATIIIE
jgi:hypothetical protein